MSLDALIMLAGAFVAVLPFSGFPPDWKSVLFFLAGIIIIGLGIVVRRGNTPTSSMRKHADGMEPIADSRTVDEGAITGN
jgi:hypothetical protein